MRVLPAAAAILLFGVFASFGVAAEEDWKLRFDEGGVRVETRAVAGSKYKTFRARTVVAADPEAVLARLRDIDSYPDWFPDTLEARRVEDGDDTWANYVVTDTPWPVKNRDAIYRNVLQREDSHLRINISADPGALPETDDAVRVPQAGGFWDLQAVDGGTMVHWEFHLEPGGSIPSGLANARVVETPKRALQALQAFFGDA